MRNKKLPKVKRCGGTAFVQVSVESDTVVSYLNFDGQVTTKAKFYTDDETAAKWLAARLQHSLTAEAPFVSFDDIPADA